MALDVSPDAIRALRGPASRAAFAERLGVTPLTVYRWELPADRPDARRPRGASLAKLEALATDGARAPAPSPLPAASPEAKDELAQLWPFVERMLAGDERRAQAELIERLARRPPATVDGRALAAVGLALAELVGRNDARAAVGLLAGAVADAQGGLLERAVAARVLATAAYIHAIADEVVFDLGKVHAFGARVESLAHPGEDDDAVHLARLAAVRGATVVADAELLVRALGRLDHERSELLPAWLADVVYECRGLDLLLAGHTAAATRIFETIAERAEGAGRTICFVRAAGFMALRQLDDLRHPTEILELASRARAALRARGVVPGAHSVFLGRCMAEALFRMGRIDEARAVYAELDAEGHFAAHVAVPPRARMEFLAGNVEGLKDLARSLQSIHHPALAAITLANTAYVEAMTALAGEVPAEAARAFDRAAMLGRRWAFLDREVELSRVLAHLLAEEHDKAEAALRRVARIGEASSSAWLSAQVLRLEGTMLAASDEWQRGRVLLDASIVTLERGDLASAAISRHVRAALAEFYDDPDRAPDELARTGARLTELGLVAPRALDLGLALVRAKRAENPTPRATEAQGAEALLVPFQRLSVRGASVEFVEQELVRVSEHLFGSETHLDPADAPARSGFTGVDFSDGAGRRLRLSVRDLGSHNDRALLALVTMHASLAMERAAAARAAPIAEPEEPGELPGFVTASPALRRLRAELGRLASSRATVIVTGESGTGKEVVARALHALSERSAGPFVAFNCAAVPRELFEGELFGYRRGAFTGATTNHPGVIRGAAGGTLFMDEIGELPLDLQPKLLRFLDSGEILPLGERKPLRADVRVVTATHRDLAELVRRGSFREDLYYRLQVVPIAVPPLRERPEDVVALARHFLKLLAPSTTLAPDAIARLARHSWPGNVRELRNVIERALAFSPAPTLLRAEHLVF